MTTHPAPGSAVLYNAATGLEKAMADADALRLVVTHAEAVAEVWDAWKISINNLPYLAWAEGVNLWIDGWSETTKRNWVHRQLEFKSLRGTLDGIRMSIDFAGRDVTPFGYSVVDATVPPQRVFSGASLTPAQREAWLSTLPQLRVWRVQEAGEAGDFKQFLGGTGPGRMLNYRFCFWGIYRGLDLETAAPDLGEPYLGELGAALFADALETASPDLGEAEFDEITENVLQADFLESDVPDLGTPTLEIPD